MNKKEKTIVSVAGIFATTVLISVAAVSCNEKKDVSNQSSESSTVTNENGSVSRSFTECTVTTNGNLVTEHRRETRTTLDEDGNILATTTSEYAQSYPVGETSLSSLTSVKPAKAKRGEGKKGTENSTFMGLKFGEEFKGTNLVADAEEPTLMRAEFSPKKTLAGFDDYYVYVTPKTHRIAKVYACAKEAVEPGSSWRRHYLIEALEKRYDTWARPRSWCRPIYSFTLGDGRYITACLAGATSDYETVLVGWDDGVLTQAEEETAALREEARKAAARLRADRVNAAATAF